MLETASALQAAPGGDKVPDWTDADQVASHVSKSSLSGMQQLWKQHAATMDTCGRAFAERIFSLHAHCLKEVASMKTFELKPAMEALNNFTGNVREQVMDTFQVMRKADDEFAAGLYQVTRKAFTKNLQQALEAKEAACADKIRRLEAQHATSISTARSAAVVQRQQDLITVRAEVERQVKEETRKKLAQVVDQLTSQFNAQMETLKQHQAQLAVLHKQMSQVPPPQSRIRDSGLQSMKDSTLQPKELRNSLSVGAGLAGVNTITGALDTGKTSMNASEGSNRPISGMTMAGGNFLSDGFQISSMRNSTMNSQGNNNNMASTQYNAGSQALRPLSATEPTTPTRTAQQVQQQQQQQLQLLEAALQGPQGTPDQILGVSLGLLRSLVQSDDESGVSMLARREMEAAVRAATQEVETLTAQVENLSQELSQERTDGENWKQKWQEEGFKTDSVKKECLQVIIKCEKKMKSVQEEHLSELSKRDAVLSRCRDTIHRLEAQLSEARRQHET